MFLKEEKMINIILAVGLVLLVLWALGLITSFTMGGYIHIMIVVAIICIIIWLVLFLLGRRR